MNHRQVTEHTYVVVVVVVDWPQEDYQIFQTYIGKIIYSRNRGAATAAARLVVRPPSCRGSRTIDRCTHEYERINKCNVSTERHLTKTRIESDRIGTLWPDSVAPPAWLIRYAVCAVCSVCRLPGVSRNTCQVCVLCVRLAPSTSLIWVGRKRRDRWVMSEYSHAPASWFPASFGQVRCLSLLFVLSFWATCHAPGSTRLA